MQRRSVSLTWLGEKPLLERNSIALRNQRIAFIRSWTEQLDIHCWRIGHKLLKSTDAQHGSVTDQEAPLPDGAQRCATNANSIVSNVVLTSLKVDFGGIHSAASIRRLGS
jgi:hypothetical protein